MHSPSKRFMGVVMLARLAANIGVAAVEGSNKSSENEVIFDKRFKSDVISQMIAGLLGAGCGASLAFWLEHYNKNKRQKGRDLSSANLVLFLLHRIWTQTRQFERETPRNWFQKVIDGKGPPTPLWLHVGYRSELNSRSCARQGSARCVR
jgi:hypothetical protein